MFDIVLIRFDGSVVVCVKEIPMESIYPILTRWDTHLEKAAILIWPSSIPMPEFIIERPS